MGFTIAAFYESVDPGAAYNAITAVSDPHLFTSGDDIRVPADYNLLIGAVLLANDASIARARISSPSLRARVNKFYERIAAALVLGNPPEVNLHADNPVELTTDEAINLEMYSDPAAAVVHQGIVLLSDANLAPPAAEILTVRATAAVALSAGAWVNGAITFEEDLAVGRYQLVGARVRGTNLVAARFVFRESPWRPGAPAINSIGDQDPPGFRAGGLGVWGEFHTNQPPTLDALGVTDTAQVLLLDLVRV